MASKQQLVRPSPSPNIALSGRAATEALQLYTRLGNAGARFDRARVTAAVTTRQGRLRLASAVTAAVRRFVRVPRRPARARRENGSRRLQARTTFSGSPGRPPRLVPCQFGYVHAELGIPAAVCSDCGAGPCIHLAAVRRRYRL